MSSADGASASAAAPGADAARDLGSSETTAADAAEGEPGVVRADEPLAVGGPERAAPLIDHIEELRAEQRRARAQRQEISRELRNAQRRKRRLEGRARQLSNDDLLTVLRMRDDTAAAAFSDAATPTASTSSGSSSATPKRTRRER